MKARIFLAGCPRIAALVEKDLYAAKFKVSVICTETGPAFYETDPAIPLRRELAGEYLPENLPPRIVEAAKGSLAVGGYNRGPERDYFDLAAVKFFGGFAHDPGKYPTPETGEYWGKLRRRIEDALRKGNPHDIADVALSLGIKLSE